MGLAGLLIHQRYDHFTEPFHHFSKSSSENSPSPMFVDLNTYERERVSILNVGKTLSEKRTLFTNRNLPLLWKITPNKGGITVPGPTTLRKQTAFNGKERIIDIYGCFLKWWYPQSPPQVLITFSRKTPWDCWGNPPFKETTPIFTSAWALKLAHQRVLLPPGMFFGSFHFPAKPPRSWPYLRCSHGTSPRWPSFQPAMLAWHLPSLESFSGSQPSSGWSSFTARVGRSTLQGTPWHGTIQTGSSEKIIDSKSALGGDMWSFPRGYSFTWVVWGTIVVFDCFKKTFPTWQEGKDTQRNCMDVWQPAAPSTIDYWTV